MPNSGLTSTTVDRLAIGPAVVYRGATIIGTLGSSATAEEVTEYRQPRIVGLTTPVEGLDRKISSTLRITGEFLEHSPAEYETWTAGINAANLVTPTDAGVLYDATQYDDDIRLVFFLGDGGQFRVRMTSGIVTGYPFSGEDPGEGSTTVTWEARSSVTSPDDATYTYVFVGAGVAADRPETGESDLVLAPPVDLSLGAQSITMLVGPAGQLGSTAGVDTNDPTYVAGPPTHFTFDATDYIDFGDVLDSVWTSGTGWTIATAVGLSAGDLAANRRLMSKMNTGATEWSLQVLAGVPYMVVLFDAAGTVYDDFTATSAITAGRKVIMATFNPALARGSRLAVYVDGVAVAGTGGSGGIDGTIQDTAAPLRIGLTGMDARQNASEQSLFYAWDRPLTAGEAATATTEIETLIGGW